MDQSRFKVKFDGKDGKDFHFRQEYCQVGKSLGDCRFQLLICSGIESGREIIGHAIGSITKRSSNRSRNKRGGKHRPKPKWINHNDIVLIQLRGEKEKVCDIIDVYTESESKILLKAGEFSENVVIRDSDDSQDGDDDTGFVFEDI